MNRILANILCSCIRNKQKRELVRNILIGAGDSCNREKGYVEYLESLKKAVERNQQEIQSLEKKLELSSFKNEMFFFELFKKEHESPEVTRKRFFKDLYCSDPKLKKMQFGNGLLLKKLDKVCRENNITYWISFGTLLGAVRHEGCIPWDDDVDVVMPRQDFLTLQALLGENEDIYVNDVYGIDKHNFCHYPRLMFRNLEIPNFIDIFIADYSSSNIDDIGRMIRTLREELFNECKNIGLTGGCSNKHDSLRREKFVGILNKYRNKLEDSFDISLTPKENVIWAIDNFTTTKSIDAPYDQIFPLVELLVNDQKFYAPKNYEQFLKKRYGNIYEIPTDMLTHRHTYLTSEQETLLDQLILQEIK